MFTLISFVALVLGSVDSVSVGVLLGYPSFLGQDVTDSDERLLIL